MRIKGIPTDLDRKKVEVACAHSKERGRPIRVSRAYKRAGWSGHLPLYVLWCNECQQGTVTHPAGKGRISCHLCREAKPVWTKKMIREDIVKPIIVLSPVFLLLFMVLYVMIR